MDLNVILLFENIIYYLLLQNFIEDQYYYDICALMLVDIGSIQGCKVENKIWNQVGQPKILILGTNIGIFIQFFNLFFVIQEGYIQISKPKIVLILNCIAIVFAMHGSSLFCSITAFLAIASTLFLNKDNFKIYQHHIDKFTQHLWSLLGKNTENLEKYFKKIEETQQINSPRRSQLEEFQIFNNSDESKKNYDKLSEKLFRIQVNLKMKQQQNGNADTLPKNDITMKENLLSELTYDDINFLVKILYARKSTDLLLSNRPLLVIKYYKVNKKRTYIFCKIKK